MTQAAREFEDPGEAEDWSVAQQKLALAYRGAGNLGQAQRLIGIACDNGAAETPMQKVRLSSAALSPPDASTRCASSAST
jgi:hypothetical protein